MSTIDFSRVLTAEDKAEAGRQAAAARLADLRWPRETGGLVLPDGSRIATSREAQATLTGAIQLVAAGVLAEPVAWKTAEGWIELDRAGLMAVAAAVAAHVQACFAAERAVLAQVPGDLDAAGMAALFDAAHAAAADRT